MTTYRLFPSTTGPSTAQNYSSGGFLSGVVFAVYGGGYWFDGYWWWVCGSNQSTSPVKCALWSASVAGQAGSGQSYVIPGTVVTSGTLTAGQWNYIPLPQAVQLAPGWDKNLTTNGGCYIAAIGCNGNFPDTNNFWGPTQFGPITNGPLIGFNGSAGQPGAPPWDFPQGVFTTGGSDPSTTMPNGASGTDNFWVDVQIDTAVPPGYSGTYRLWPNMGQANTTTSGDAAVNYTVGTEVVLSQQCTLNNIWYFSPGTATTLATRADVWSVSTGLPVATISSPTWLTISGASGAAGGGWLKTAFPGGTTLAAGDYRVTVFNSNGTSDANWSAKDAATDYWGWTFLGAGSAGAGSGPISAPNYAGASAGYNYSGANPGGSPPYSGTTAPHAQPPFGQNPGGTIQNPVLFAAVGGSLNQTQNYWVDLEVTPQVVTSPPPLFLAPMRLT